jgi:peroxiredoxin
MSSSIGEVTSVDVPQTLEGWYVLHDAYRLSWEKLRVLSGRDRSVLAAQTAEWSNAASAAGEGDSAAYSLISQKGDLMWVHYRRTPEALNAVELSLRALPLYDYLEPAYGYFSVIEASLYELTAIAMKRLAERGLRPGTPEYDAAKDEEFARQKTHMDERLYRKVPPQRYICFYPMNKRRGEHVNWYTLTLDERRAMMRNHGSIGHKYVSQVTQVISGSVGLDDWEWGVSLHADDALVFKKLIYEMRFDPTSALYAEFGPFYVGVRMDGANLANLIAGKSASSQ